jgi:hypothetical protein
MKQLDKETEQLIALYRNTYEYLMQQLVKKIEKGLSQQHILSVMREIEKVLQSLDEKAYTYCRDTLPLYYLTGIVAVDKDVILLKLNPLEEGKVLHKFAIERASSSMFASLAARTRFMEEEAKRVIRQIAGEAISRQLITGETRKAISKEIAEGLQNQGIHSFIDNANRKWNLDRYAEMAVRTKTRILVNDGTMDRLTAYRQKYHDNQNFDLIQISNHNAKDWCRHFEDCVFSISGNHPYYPSVKELPNGYSTLHPCCRHIFKPYIESLRGKGKIADSRYLGKSIKELNKLDYHARKK